MINLEIFKKPNRNLMIDLETLGITPGYVILSLSAQEFYYDETTKQLELGDHFNEYFDLEESLQGYKIDPTTLEWWSSKEGFTSLLSKCNSTPNSIKETLINFRNFLTGDIPMNDIYRTFLYGKSNTFDLEPIKYYFKNEGLEFPIYGKNEFDFRTIEKFFLHKYPISEPTHEGLQDARDQIEKINLLIRESDGQ